MNLLGLEAQRVGRIAQQRVEQIAGMLGFEIQYNPAMDYGNKTDLVIAGVNVQISVDRKSIGEQKRLAARGICSIVAGDRYSDNDIVNQIQLLFKES